eukprot:351639-Chlamydomonas_euryale.AAC.5
MLSAVFCACALRPPGSPHDKQRQLQTHHEDTPIGAIIWQQHMAACRLHALWMHTWQRPIDIATCVYHPITQSAELPAAPTAVPATTSPGQHLRIVRHAAICQRLKQLTEHLFPEEVSARRRQLADETHAAAAAALAQRTAAAAERSRDQRRRTLRVRRTLPRGSPPGSPLLAPPPVPSPPQHPSPLLHVASPVTPGSIYGPVASTPTPGSFPVRVSNWDPPEVTFTMGWYEPPPPERRTRKSGRVRAAAARAAM